MPAVKPLYRCPASGTSLRYYILCHLNFFKLNVRVPTKHEGIRSLRLNKLEIHDAVVLVIFKLKYCDCFWFFMGGWGVGVGGGVDVHRTKQVLAYSSFCSGSEYCNLSF
jgi:hypothetical protein